MRLITYAELLSAANSDRTRINLLRDRDQIALALARADCYREGSYMEVDAVAMRLADVLAETQDRELAATIVRDQWAVWMRCVALAETDPKQPVFFYVVDVRTPNGETRVMTLGSTLDSASTGNLHRIALDLRERFGVTPHNFVCIDMQQVIADVRRTASDAGYDWGDPFLPPYGDARLEQFLADDGATDRAIIVVKDAKGRLRLRSAGADGARRTGAKARKAFETDLQ